MKKIMFSDVYGLTEAVLSGRKTQTRRMVPKSFFTDNEFDIDEKGIFWEDMYGDWHDIRKSKYAYKVGEVVAVAQSYKDIAERLAKKGYDVAKWMDEHHITKNLAGWLNKMFVKADLMIFKIRITNVRVERLNEISEDDCRREGIDSWRCQGKRFFGFFDNAKNRFSRHNTPREAYAALIDRISGRGVWLSNPWVFAYDFELVK